MFAGKGVENHHGGGKFYRPGVAGLRYDDNVETVMDVPRTCHKSPWGLEFYCWFRDFETSQLYLGLGISCRHV